MHLSRSSSPRIFHLFVAGILVASCCLDCWPCTRIRILHRRFHQFPQSLRYEVLIYKLEQNDQLKRKRCRFFLALGTDFYEKHIHPNFHIFVKIFSFVSIMTIAWRWAVDPWLRGIVGSVAAVTLSIILFWFDFVARIVSGSFQVICFFCTKF